MRRFLAIVIVLGALAGVAVGLFVAPLAVTLVLDSGGGQEPPPPASDPRDPPDPPDVEDPQDAEDPQAAEDGEAEGAAAEAEPSGCTAGPLELRAAQVIVAGMPDVADPEDPLARQLTDLGVGGVFLSEPNVRSSEQVRALTGAMEERSPNGLLVTADEEGGRVSGLRDLLGPTPSARELAATSGPEEIEAAALRVGQELASLGVDLDLAPVADLDSGPAGGIVGDRSFSGDPATASTAALAYARGLAAAGVVPTAKHFPGHGGSTADSHETLATLEVTREELEARDLVPFDALIAAGIPVVMTSHVAYSALDPELPASLAPQTYALLRDLGFTGVALTDSIGMGAVNTRWGFTEATVMAVAAGADAVLATDGSQAVAMRDALVAAVADGRLPEERLDEAAARVLALKGVDPAVLTCSEAEVPTGLGGGATVTAGRGVEGVDLDGAGDDVPAEDP